MFVLRRKVGESIVIGDIVITVVDIRGSRVRLGVEAASSVHIQRGEKVPQVQSDDGGFDVQA